jgi:ParB/RepB/Spo0J family partition protein
MGKGKDPPGKGNLAIQNVGSTKYEIVCGERRVLACRDKLGWTHIPATIIACSDREMLQIALIENDQREQFAPFELALGYKALYEEVDEQGKRIFTIRTLAEVLGKNKDHIQEYLNMVDAPDDVKQLILDDPSTPVRIINELSDVPLPEDRAHLIAGVQSRRWKTDDIISIVRTLKKQPGATGSTPPAELLSSLPTHQATPSSVEAPHPSQTAQQSGVEAQAERTKGSTLPAKTTTVEAHERITRPSPTLALAERLRTLAKDDLQVEKIVKKHKSEIVSMSEEEQKAVREHVQQWMSVLQQLL